MASLTRREVLINRRRAAATFAASTLPSVEPSRVITDSILGIIATGAELLFGLLLLVGWYTRVTALLSGLLLLVLGASMALGLGVQAPLNYAVFTGAGSAFLLDSWDSIVRDNSGKSSYQL